MSDSVRSPVSFFPGVTMKKISLANNNGFALVDDADFESLNKYKWYLRRRKGAKYAYRLACVNGWQKRILLHRHLLGLISKQRIDHINHNGLDNRRANLRKCTIAENARNCRIRSDNTSGFKGVAWHRNEKKWVASICVNRSQIRVGRYFCIMAAARAYDKAAEKYFGEFACTNESLAAKSLLDKECK